MSTRTYDPGQIVVIFKGIQISGFAPGTFITITRETDTFTKSVGADGEVARTRSRNKSGSGNVTLMQSSLSNDLLSAFALADEDDGSGSGPLLVKDLNGTTLVKVENAWIRKMPDPEYGAELADREWPFDFDKVDTFLGGTLSA